VSQRFFSSTPIDGNQAVLGGSEAHHLIHVMRASVGAGATLFDGGGAEFEAEIHKVERNEVHFVIHRRLEVDRESAIRLTMAVALPKGDRQRYLVEKCVELGVRELVPLISERSVARPSEASIGKMQRVVIESSKQCGRNRLMKIGLPLRSEELFKSAATPSRWIAVVSGPNTVQSLPKSDEFTELCAAIGPEGGFSPDEVELAQHHGWRPIHLGPRILRVETAAVKIAAIFG